ncbi:response regulator [Paenibacillus rhizovicinus]|uniref:Response regulator n=1 Tax=Paenibacillus rhizovicinus TaxID=2704463 RepID=A0A6C0P5K5_9BACL|nr:response regulator [Paenibacillus rhizovicinus]QHW33735.1 response regulator [Paenibacillus rhizovicinus]
MLKVLILEDEPILRQGLVNKISMDKLPLVIAGEADNGIDGLELLIEIKPDIVLTDIRMPGMDGLDFIEQALLLQEKLNVIIVSGYGEFEYAKRAMSYGVSDYLLKPVDSEELREALLKAIHRIEEERALGEERALLLRNQALNKETLRQQHLTKLIQLSAQTEMRNEITNPRIEEVQAHFDRYLVVALVLEPYALPHYSFREGEEELVRFAVENIMSDRMASSGRQGVLFTHAIHENEMLYMFGFNRPEERNAIHALMRDVLDGIQNYLKLKATVSIGKTVDRIEDIQQSYRQAKLIIRNKVIRGTGHIFEYEHFQQQLPIVNPFLSQEDERILLQWLEDCNEAACTNWIEQRLEILVASPSSTFSQLEWFCVDVYLLFQKFLAKTTAPERLIGDMDELLQWLQNMTTWQEAVRKLNSHAGNIVGYFVNLNHGLHADVMEKAKQYLDTCFNEPISLQKISDTYYIHPNYFSKRFKEKFGVSFHEYLTELRMKSAAKWMLETDLKISHIAGKVGYEDPAYFGSVFRKCFGMSPKQFRAQMKAVK